ncbi:zeaxanthin epoxidase [Trifolium repens]|nr:zeaxanthin epoxidase [Trifolium repens]
MIQVVQLQFLHPRFLQRMLEFTIRMEPSSIEGKRYRVPPNYPAQVHPFDVLVFCSDKVSFRVKVKSAPPSISKTEETQVLQGGTRRVRAKLRFSGRQVNWSKDQDVADDWS